MDSTSNKNTTKNNTNNNQEQEPFSSSSFNHPLISYDHLPTFNPINSTEEPSSSTQPPPPTPTPTPTRSSKKRTRASRRAPTTVLTTDTTNFRSMVQQFTGFPTPPFPRPPSSSSFLPYCLPIKPTPSSLVDSIAAINAAINGRVTLENMINSCSGDSAALANYPLVNPNVMHNTVLAPQFGDLGGPSGGLSGWAECGDHQDDSNIRRVLVQPPYKRQATEGAVIESWSTSSSD